MMLEELQLPPPPPISPLAAAVRYGASTLVCGGALPLVAALSAHQHRGAEPPHDGHLHLLVIVLALLAL